MPPELENTSQVIDTAPPAVGVGHDVQPEVKADATPNWEDAADADLSAVFRKLNPERETDGKFASREPKPETAQATTETTDQAQIEKVEQPPAAITAPQSWSAEMKAVFPSLPPAVQEFVTKRESEAQTKITQQGQEISTYQPVKAVIEQHKDIFERNGLDYSDGLGRLLNAERMLEQNPRAAIAQIAQAYGVDLGQLGTGQQQPQNSAEAALHQRIAQLESQLNETVNKVQTREQAEALSTQKSNLSLIEKFSQDKPDWADLENDILTEITGMKAAVAQGLLPAMEAPDMLAKAYERAQRNNPIIWEKKLKADKEAEEAKRIEAAKKNSADAKKAKSVNIASSPVNGRTISNWDDDLKETYRRLNAS